MAETPKQPQCSPLLIDEAKATEQEQHSAELVTAAADTKNVVGAAGASAVGQREHRHSGGDGSSCALVVGAETRTRGGLAVTAVEGNAATRSATRVHGTIRSYSPDQGFGFIRPVQGSRQVYFHHTSVDCCSVRTSKDGRPVLVAGQCVSFVCRAGKKNKSRAVGVRAVVNHGTIRVVLEQYGFIEDDADGSSVYVHRDKVVGSPHAVELYRVLKPGQRVSYSTRVTCEGKVQAIALRVTTPKTPYEVVPRATVSLNRILPSWECLRVFSKSARGYVVGTVLERKHDCLSPYREIVTISYVVDGRERLRDKMVEMKSITDEELIPKIREQVHFYLGVQNPRRDEFLACASSTEGESWIRLNYLITFAKMRELQGQRSSRKFQTLVRDALQNSSVFEVSARGVREKPTCIADFGSDRFFQRTDTNSNFDAGIVQQTSVDQSRGRGHGRGGRGGRGVGRGVGRGGRGGSTMELDDTAEMHVSIHSSSDSGTEERPSSSNVELNVSELARKRQMLGDKLYGLVHAQQPLFAEKIAGILLSMQPHEIEECMTSQAKLTAQVNEPAMLPCNALSKGCEQPSYEEPVDGSAEQGSASDAAETVYDDGKSEYHTFGKAVPLRALHTVAAAERDEEIARRLDVRAAEARLQREHSAAALATELQLRADVDNVALAHIQFEQERRRRRLLDEHLHAIVVDLTRHSYESSIAAPCTNQKTLVAYDQMRVARAALKKVEEAWEQPGAAKSLSPAALEETRFRSLSEMRRGVHHQCADLFVQDPEFCVDRRVQDQVWRMFSVELKHLGKRMGEAHGDYAHLLRKHLTQLHKEATNYYVALIARCHANSINIKVDAIIGDESAGSHIIHSSMLALGDLARYWEQHQLAEASRDWAHCKRCYETARRFSCTGQGDNALGVVAIEESQPFSAAYWFARSITSPTPFESQNLIRHLRKSAKKFTAGASTDDVNLYSRRYIFEHQFMRVFALLFDTSSVSTALVDLNEQAISCSMQLQDLCTLDMTGLEDGILLQVIVLCIVLVTVRQNFDAEDPTSGSCHTDIAISLVLHCAAAISYAITFRGASGERLAALAVLVDWLSANPQLLQCTEADTHRGLSWLHLQKQLKQMFACGAFTEHAELPCDGMLPEDIELRGFMPFAETIRTRTQSHAAHYGGHVAPGEMWTRIRIARLLKFAELRPECVDSIQMLQRIVFSAPSASSAGNRTENVAHRHNTAPSPPPSVVSESEQLPKEYEEPPLHLCCPISQELMLEPVMVVETGQTYERSEIESWLAMHNTDPATNTVLHDKSLVPNVLVRKLSLEWQQDH